MASLRSRLNGHTLRLDPQNARLHPDDNKALIRASLEEVGAFRSIGVDGENIIRAGNGVYEQAQTLGLKVRIVDAKPGELIAVRRPDLKGSKAIRAALLDNRTGELSAWEPSVLAEFERAGLLEGLSLEEFLAKAALAVDEGPEPRLDQAAELKRKWGTRLGQVWEIGRHRMACADSTDLEAVRVLMRGRTAAAGFSDPPWNVDIGGDGNPRHRQREGLKNDKLSTADFGTLLEGVGATAREFVRGDLYCVMGTNQWPAIDAHLRAAGFHWSTTIIWVKDSFVLGRSNYHRRYEPIWYGWPAKGRSSFSAGRAEDDVWEIPRPKRSEEHPTMKPVALVARALRNSTRAGDLVLDQFLGSGTTCVAAEQLGRACCGLENDPKYAAVSLQRLADMGLKPRLAGQIADVAPRSRGAAA